MYELPKDAEEVRSQPPTDAPHTSITPPAAPPGNLRLRRHPGPVRAGLGFPSSQATPASLRPADRPRRPPSPPARATWPRPPRSPLDVALVRQVIVEHLEAGGGFQVSETHGVSAGARSPVAAEGKKKKERQRPAAAGAEGGRKKGPGRPEKSLYRDGGVSLRCTG